MNLLEHYIIKIISEEPNKKYGGVDIVAEADCYGDKREYKHYACTKEQWEKEKQQGYWMA